TPTATASVTNGRCSTSSESRRSASLLSFAASLPIFAASSRMELAPPRNRSAMPFNAEATVSPTRSAACAALAAERPPARSSRRSNARKRWSNSPISAEIAPESSERENMLSPRADACRKATSSIRGFEPGVDLAVGFVLRHAVALLKPAAELRALALDDVEVIAGELAPLLLNLAFELLPIAFDTIPIHRFAP